MICDFSALTGVFRNLPEDSAERAAHAVNIHRRIFVYGAGRSGLMLKAFAMRLAQAGRTVYVVGETVTPAIESDDLLILASASGNTASVCRYAKTAKEIGADLFILTASEHSELSGISCPDVRFCAPNKEDSGEGIHLMGTLFEQALLLFCDQVVLLLGENADGMRRRHANLE